MLEVQMQLVAERLQAGIADELTRDQAVPNGRVLKALPYSTLVALFAAVLKLVIPVSTQTALLRYASKNSTYRGLDNEPVPQAVVDDVVETGIRQSVPVLSRLLNEENWEWKDDKPVRCKIPVEL